ncbi:MAG: T9SS type A sorting domain-containing protein [Bacteroidetes bacterium]|nr:T9SS type A sorting domain-containing protein [Bacteroidota bacterium]
MRHLFWALVLFSASREAGAQQVRATQYHINLDVNKAAKKLSGFTTILLKADKPFDHVVRLDLLGFTVDSVKVDGILNSFQRSGSKLLVPVKIPKPAQPVAVRVYYGGTPQKDASWGGFYFDGPYAYNMGVGFDADPHPFGRCWFPCFDTFTSKATYSFSIGVDSTDVALCNGLLSGTSADGPGRLRWNWELNEPIPSYLASVAVAPYKRITGNLNGVSGPVPYVLAALAADTSKMKASFVNLQTAFSAFEEAYGPHRFNRVGFNAVPFTGGAMEHSTNIAYPLFAVDGTLNYETLYAHELSHHWWGDNVTCATQEDMWLNEGWASYSEKLFIEKKYGQKAYADAMKAHHNEVLRLAHVRDGAVLPVSGIGHEHTYGSHVYKKGADMVHTMRWWMSDRKWKDACIKLQDSFRYGNISTDVMYSIFLRYSLFDLQPFFSQWVKKEGFPGLKIARYEHGAQGDKYQGTALLVQQSRFNYHTYTDFPVWIRWIGADGRGITTLHTVKQAVQEIRSPLLSFDPVLAELDPGDRMSLARTHSYLRMKGDTTTILPYEYVQVNLKGAADSCTVIADHQWVGASLTSGNKDRAQPSNYRHWIISGDWVGKSAATFTFEYDGRKSTNRTGYLDHTLIPGNEDSLVMLYREHHFVPWRRLTTAEFNKGNRFDRTGTVKVANALPGEYVLANFDPLLGTQAPSVNTQALRAYPNPTGKMITVEWSETKVCDKILLVYDGQGREVLRTNPKRDSQRHELNLVKLPAGIYVVELNGACLEERLQAVVLREN